MSTCLLSCSAAAGRGYANPICPTGETYTQPAALQAAVSGRQWFHTIDFGQGVVSAGYDPTIQKISGKTPASKHSAFRHFSRPSGYSACTLFVIWGLHATATAGLKLAVDFKGRTVLDVGAYDGALSIHAARQGAKRVLATDHFGRCS